MSGRKVFTAGEVLQAADVNDFLMDQSVMVFAGTAARGSAIPSPSEGMVTYLEDADELQVYTTDWGAVGKKILQVLSTAKTDTFSVSSATFTDITGLSVSITPSSTSSKVLVLTQCNWAPTGGNNGSLRVLRDSTAINVGGAAGSRVVASFHRKYSYSNDQNEIQSSTGVFLDSPATTSAVTYKLQTRGESTNYVNRTVADTDSTDGARTASTITVMEVAG